MLRPIEEVASGPSASLRVNEWREGGREEHRLKPVSQAGNGHPFLRQGKPEGGCYGLAD